MNALDPLVPFGWDDRWALVAQEFAGAPGRVVRVDRGLASVFTAHGVVRVPTAAELRTGDPIALPATGDWVVVGEIDGEPTVTAVLPRRSAFVRGDPMEGWAVSAQVVAANVDAVFIVQSLNNGPNLRRLERELILAFDSGAEPTVVLTKSDLVTDASPAVTAVRTVSGAVPVVVTSSVRTEGIEDLRAAAAGNRTVAFIGASGVGKSTLVNLLVGDDVQRTGEVRATDQRGRHTTTARELIVLASGGVLIDTPGLRAVALWDVDEGFSRAFADIEGLALGCRFNDCAHDREPGCAVRAAVDAGALDEARLASYRRLDGELDRLAEEAQERERNRRGAQRTLSRTIRGLPKRP